MKTGIIALIAETGGGKTELTTAMLRRYPQQLAVIKSTTTRARRTGKDGANDDRDYRFVNAEEFSSLEKARKFVKVFRYGNVPYATQIDDIEAIIRDGKFGIGAFIEPAIPVLQSAGYVVYPILLKAINHKRRPDPARAKDDAERAKMKVATIEIINDHAAPNGLQLAEQRLADVLRGIFRGHGLEP